MLPTEGVRRNRGSTPITIGARTAGLEVGMLPGSQRSSVEDVAEVRRWSAVEAAEVLAGMRSGHYHFADDEVSVNIPLRYSAPEQFSQPHTQSCLLYTSDAADE